jgi:hypothetical protein
MIKIHANLEPVERAREGRQSPTVDVLGLAFENKISGNILSLVLYLLYQSSAKSSNNR